MALSETNCDWERTATGVRCKRDGCGNRMSAPATMALERIHAECWGLDPDKKGVQERRRKAAEQRHKYGYRDLSQHPCKHLGEATGEMVNCRGCGGKTIQNALYGCDLYGSCLPFTLDDAAKCCRICDDYSKVNA